MGGRDIASRIPHKRLTGCQDITGGYFSPRNEVVVLNRCIFPVFCGIRKNFPYLYYLRRNVKMIFVGINPREASRAEKFFPVEGFSIGFVKSGMPAWRQFTKFIIKWHYVVSS